MALQSVQWGPGRKAACLDFIDHELQTARSARQTLERTWREYHTQYRAPAKQPMKRFPYDGAPNYVLPITATDVDQLVANFMTTIHAPDNLWTLKPLNERWQNAAKPLQDYLGWLDRALIKMWDVNYRAIPEMVKLGTAIYKTGWYYEKRRVTMYDGQGGMQRVTVLKGFPWVDHVRCIDFILPSYSYAIDPDVQGGAPWVAERIEKSETELRFLAMAQEGFQPTIQKEDLDQVIAGARNEQTDYDQNIQRLDYVKRGEVSAAAFDSSVGPADTGTLAPSGTVAKVELFEIHLRFATQGTDQDDVVLLYHPPTRTVLRATYQPYGHGKRPYEAVRYFRGEGFWGIGVCEQKEVFQRLQSQLMNDQLTNVELANTRMWAIKGGANIAPGEPIYPGRVIVTDGDPRAEVMSFQMSDIYQSLPQSYAMVQALAERRTGISDIQLGNMQSLPGRTPATTTMSLLQEGSRRPDLTIKDMRYSGLSIVGLRLLQLSQQYMQSGTMQLGGEQLLALAMDMLGTPEGMEVGSKLAVPMDDVALGLGVSITATSGSANKEVERQGNIALLQLASQIYPQYVQLAQVGLQAQMMGAQPLADIAVSAMRGTSELFLRVLEQFDVRNPEIIVPQVGQTAPGTTGVLPGAGGPSGGGPASPDQLALMAALSGAAGGGGGAGGGQAAPGFAA